VQEKYQESYTCQSQDISADRQIHIKRHNSYTADENQGGQYQQRLLPALSYGAVNGPKNLGYQNKTEDNHAENHDESEYGFGYAQYLGGKSGRS